MAALELKLLRGRGSGSRPKASVSSCTALGARSTLRAWPQVLPRPAPPIAARTAIEAGPPVWFPREAGCGCRAKFEVASDLGGRAAVESLEDPFTILRAELVQELVSADSSRLDPKALFSEKRGHHVSQVAAVGSTYWSPFARPANRALLPPPPHDDEVVIPAEDRLPILAARPDAIYSSCGRGERVTVARA